MVYLCDFLFGGSTYQFSRALNLNQGHLWQALYSQSRVTANMLAQVVACTNVRAEWLLCGTGPVFVTPANKVDAEFELPPALHSSFATFDGCAIPNIGALPSASCAKLKLEEPSLTPEAISAARAVHRARVAGKPVSLFLGSDAAHDGCLELAKAFIAKEYVTHVAMTAAVIPYDLGRRNAAPVFDVNYVARLAALQGTGYGEALGRWAADNKSTHKSLLAGLLHQKTPITVHVELGELAEHFLPALHGAELGASIGAAAYTDLLVFAEQIRQFCGPAGGVFIVLGEPARAIQLFLKTVAAIRAAVAPNLLTEFTVIVLAHSPVDVPPVHVTGVRGHTHFLEGTYPTAAANLLHACTAVYDGTISHDT